MNKNKIATSNLLKECIKKYLCFFENQLKSTKIYEIPCKSSEAKKPASNRAKVSLGAAGRILTVVPGFTRF